jgi:hypothetical protein
MTERENTIVCAFDLKSPCFSACGVHEQMSLEEKKELMAQIGSPKQKGYVKFRDDSLLQDVIHYSRMEVEFGYNNTEISMVRIETAELP